MTTYEQRVREMERWSRQRRSAIESLALKVDRLTTAAIGLRMYTENWDGPSGGGPPCTGTVTFNTRCNGNLFGPVSILITKPDTTTTTVSTSILGSTLFAPGAAGVYTWAASASGYTTATGSFTFVCGVSQTVNIAMTSLGVTITGRVTGCTGDWDPGIGSVSVTSSGDWSGSATTDSLGYYSLTIPVHVGTVTLTVAVSKYKTVTKTVSIQCNTFVITATNGNESLPALNSNFALAPDDNHTCVPCCKTPIKKTLSFDSDLISLNLVFGASGLGYWNAFDETVDVACVQPNCSTAAPASLLTFLIRAGFGSLTGCSLRLEAAICDGAFNGLKDAGASGSPTWAEIIPMSSRAWFYIVQDTPTCSPFTVTGTIYELFPGEDPSSDPVPFVYGISGSCSMQTDRSWPFTITEAP